jgi:hypothetical protein
MSTTDVIKFVPENLVRGDKSFADVNEDISKPLESFPTGRWWVLFLAAPLRPPLRLEAKEGSDVDAT